MAGPAAGRVRDPWMTFACWRCSTTPAARAPARWTGSTTGGRPGREPGQYRLDLAADGPRCRCCTVPAWRCCPRSRGGPATGPSGLLAVIDPVDGSTNAHRGVPFYSTSICVLDAEGPRVGVVINQATGARYAAVRGGGAERDGRPSRRRGARTSGAAIVGISGFPGRHPGWAQFRALGAASLECCAVAEGVARRLPRRGRQHPLRLGLSGRAARSAGRRARRRASETGGIWSCATPSPRRPIVAATRACWPTDCRRRTGYDRR